MKCQRCLYEVKWGHAPGCRGEVGLDVGPEKTGTLDCCNRPEQFGHAPGCDGSKDDDGDEVTA